MILLQILIFGLFKSAVYALIAVGFTLIFGVARVINLGHGTFYMLGAYLTYLLVTHINLNPFLCLLISSIIVGLIGVAMDFFLIRPMRSDGCIRHCCYISFCLGGTIHYLFIFSAAVHVTYPTLLPDKSLFSAHV